MLASVKILQQDLKYGLSITVNKDIWQQFSCNFFAESVTKATISSNTMSTWVTAWMHAWLKVWWLHSSKVTTSMRNDSPQMLAITFKLLWSQQSVISFVIMITDWLASLAFRAAKWRANNFGSWSCLTQLTLGISPPSLQCFNRNGIILSILSKGMLDKVHLF